MVNDSDTRGRGKRKKNNAINVNDIRVESKRDIREVYLRLLNGCRYHVIDVSDSLEFNILMLTMSIFENFCSFISEFESVVGRMNFAKTEEFQKGKTENYDLS